jgi:hypothetical protein
VLPTKAPLCGPYCACVRPAEALCLLRQSHMGDAATCMLACQLAGMREASFLKPITGSHVVLWSCWVSWTAAGRGTPFRTDGGAGIRALHMHATAGHAF